MDTPDTNDATEKQPSSVVAAVIHKLLESAAKDASLHQQIEECFEEILEAQKTYSLAEIAKALQDAGIEISADYLSKAMQRICKARGIVRRNSKKRAKGAPVISAKPVSATTAKTSAAAVLAAATNAASRQVRQGDFDRNTGRPENELF